MAIMPFFDLKRYLKYKLINISTSASFLTCLARVENNFIKFKNLK